MSQIIFDEAKNRNSWLKKAVFECRYTGKLFQSNLGYADLSWIPEEDSINCYKAVALKFTCSGCEFNDGCEFNVKGNPLVFIGKVNSAPQGEV